MVVFEGQRGDLLLGMPTPVTGSPELMRYYERLTEAIAHNLKRLREEAGLSQENAAHQCTLSLNAYHRTEAGGVNVTVATLARLALGFGVDVEELVKMPRHPKAKTPTTKRRAKKSRRSS